MQYGGYDDDSYTAADARYDEWTEKKEKLIEQSLTPLVDAVIGEIMELEEEMEEAREEPGFTDPHPWTWTRDLLAVWDDEENGGEDVVRELLSDHFREEAEENAQEIADDGP